MVAVATWDMDSVFMDIGLELSGGVLDADRAPWASFWKPLGCVMVEHLPGEPGPFGLRPVMSHAVGSALAFLGERVELLRYLARFGEILPSAEFRGREVLTFHCLNYVDLLDEERSTGLMWGGQGADRYVYGYESLAFDDGAADEAEIFGLPQLSGGSAFYSERAQRSLAELAGPEGLGVRFVPPVER